MVIGRIDKQAFAGPLIPDQIAVYAEIAHLNLSYDHASISNPFACAPSR
jgi:hypothetical protein